MKRTPANNPTEKFFVIDPGNVYSAWVIYDRQGKIWGFAKELNETVLERLTKAMKDKITKLVIETPQPRGQLASWQLFHTCIWIGRFTQLWFPRTVHNVDRAKVKMHLCESARAKDKNIRAALVERWGGKEVAIGKKKTPGPLYGVSADVWQALGVAVTFVEGGA